MGRIPARNRARSEGWPQSRNRRQGHNNTSGRHPVGSKPRHCLRLPLFLGGTGSPLFIAEPLYQWLSTHRNSLPGEFLGVFTEDKPFNYLGRSFVLIPTLLVLSGLVGRLTSRIFGTWASAASHQTSRLPYRAACTIALSARVLDGAHWPSDTFFAEAYGWTVGRAVADRYRERLPDRAIVQGGAGFGVGLRLSF